MYRKFISAFAAIAIVTAPASADPAGKDVSIKVSYADLDLTSAAGVKTLVIRLESAISKVCGRTDKYVPAAFDRRVSACRAKAMSNAVAAIDAPLLTALHDGGNAMVASR